MRPGIHYANLAKSPRLQRLLAYLRVCGSQGATTREIIDGADICAVNSAVCELKKQGFAIVCQMEGRTVSGSSVFRYKLTEATP
ncbi:MAG: hypothetical protein M3Y08_01160 [Fibrobacterota bacterium]|nr:hypothetical protein [Fibrobacterota bacterium]